MALLALSGLGCSSRERLVPGIAVGRIVYHVGDDAPFCENDAQYLSDSLESLEELLGRRAAPRVHYYRLGGSLAEHCEDEVSGCARLESDSIYSNYPALGHELVHMITERERDHAPYFREGLAEALGEFGSLKLGEENPALASENIDVEDLIVSQPPRGYDTAATTVTSLLDRLGVGATLDFYDALGATIGAPQLEAALGVVGVRVSELVDWHAEQRKNRLAGAPHLRCSASPADFDTSTGAWSFQSETIGCDAAGHRRTLSRGFVYRRKVTLSPTNSPSFFAHAHVPAGAWLAVSSCEAPGGLAVQNPGDEASDVWTVGRLTAGVHTASVQIPEEAGLTAVEVVVQPTGDEPRSVTTTTHLRMLTSSETTLPIRLLRAGTVEVGKLTSSSGALDVCSSASSSTACTRVKTRDAVPLAAGDHTLRFTSDTYAAAEVELRQDP